MIINKHKLLLLLHDFVVSIFAAFVSYFLIFTFNSSTHDITHQLTECIFGVLCSIIIVLLFNDNFYKYQFVLNPAKHIIGLFKILTTGLVILILFAFFVKLLDIIGNRIFVGEIFLIFFIVFIISRVLIIPRLYYWLVQKKHVSRNMIIIGTGELSIEKVKFLNKSKRSYYNILGYLDIDVAMTGKIIEGYPVLGHIKNLRSIIETYKIKDVLISLENMSNLKLQRIINFCKRSGCTIHVVSELYDIVTEKIEIDEIGGISSFRLRQTNHAFYETIKRVYDIIISLTVIIVFLPIWLLIVFLIKITSKGPVLYYATVVGFREKKFTMYKFRSMYYKSSINSHRNLVTEMILQNKPTEKLKSDNRITFIGKILRKLSIDEFPQFINVLKGNMSIVGPRPCLPYEYEVMDKWHRGRFKINPGITGLWQIKGRNEVRFNDQIALDLYYIEHRSLRLDFEILLKTIPVLVLGKGGA